MLILPGSAEITLMKEMRTFEYMKTIHWMKENLSDHRVIFMETVTDSGSFIEDYYPVFYTNSYNPEYQNQGSNHGLSLKSFFYSNQIDDNELVVHTTGRYHFLDMHFFDTIKENPGFDFYGRVFGGPQYFTGCFAMSAKFLKEWVFSTDWKDLNNRMINFEKSLYDFVSIKELNKFHLDQIHMDCNIFSKGNPDRHIV